MNTLNMIIDKDMIRFYYIVKIFFLNLNNTKSLKSSNNYNCIRKYQRNFFL